MTTDLMKLRELAAIVYSGCCTAKAVDEYRELTNPAKVIALLDALEALGREVARLTACINTANSNHEEFERKWYLACDERDQARAALEVEATELESVWSLSKKADEENDTLRAELAELKPLAALGAEMHAMTTTVHTDSIPFNEQLQIVPSLWLECMKERDQARAELESKAAELESVWSLSKKADEENDTLRAELAAIRATEADLQERLREYRTRAHQAEQAYLNAPVASPDVGAQEPVDLSRLDPWVQGLGKAVLAELKSAQSQAAQEPVAWQGRWLDMSDASEGWSEWRNVDTIDLPRWQARVAKHPNGFELRALCVASPVAKDVGLVADGCLWTQDSHFEMGDTYDSGCGEKWSFIDGGPEENNVRFCQGCGKPVKLAASPKLGGV